jgi:rubrerythrin
LTPGAGSAPQPAAVPRQALRLGSYRAPRDQALYLLRLAAEVEHALMVQYLFAAWSLGGAQIKDPKHLQLAQSWRATILQIAREEMAHLATVENLITSIGGAPSFAREDYPVPANLYPFELQLEPLTKSALAKYVLSEMPSDVIVAQLGFTAEMNSIRSAVSSQQQTKVHRVGRLYDAVARLFKAPSPSAKQAGRSRPFIATADIQADSVQYQVQPGEWGLGYSDLFILAPGTRDGALAAIKHISDQGEGNGLEEIKQSHFGKFLEIYRRFPEPAGWIPARRLAHNPTTDWSNTKATYIRNPFARVWARLFNVRYRMLLMFLAHSFAIESAAASNSKGLLISWAFGEMYNLRSIADVLMSLPIGNNRDELAGPPFEMPASLDLPSREPDRWRVHRDLLLTSQYYVDRLLRLAGGSAYERYLRSLKSVDARALEQTLKQIGA